MDHRLHHRLHHLATAQPPQEPPRNPLRREADAFRVLMMVVAGGALVVAATLLISELAGALLALVLLGYGLWRAVGLVQAWRREGSDPER